MSDDVRFRNSKEWIDYSHQRYLPLEEIRRRLKPSQKDWSRLASHLATTRLSQSIPLPIPSLNKSFWYFEADCVRAKTSDVERLGLEIYDKIHSHLAFEKEIVSNASAEEAITSAIYEGANTTRARARQFLAEHRPPRDKNEQMLINNFEAMQWIKKNSTLELDQDALLKIHSIVTRRTLEGNDVNYSGKFRDDVVYVGKHQGIDYRKIPPALAEAVDVATKNRRFIHPLVRGILLHYFVAYIHPFFDGNGRTARTFFYFHCIRNRMPFVELLSLSAYLKDHGQAYIRAFENAVLHGGDVTYFVDFSLDALLMALKVVGAKVEFLQQIWSLKQPYYLKDRQVLLLQRMALNKFAKITIEEYAQQTNLSHEMARLELKSLSRQALFVEQKVGKKLAYTIDSKHLKKLVSEIVL